MKRLSTVLLLLAGLIWLLNGSAAFAQTSTGKIAGKIVDAESGEAIIGANVTLLNTSLGAATNLDGEYVILNIVPGTYTVRVNYIGYQGQLIEDVRVVAGVTQEVDVKLKASAVELADVVITAERKYFEEKATNDIRVYDSHDVATLPVKGVEKVLGIQAGAVMQEGSGGVAGNATINVRGGRGGEVLYVIDGVPQNDPFTGTNYAQVSTNAVEQVAFQLGGYEAKYGQAQSGIVNLTTKTGGPTYNLYGDVLSSTWTDDYGYNLYSGTLSGPIIPGLNSQTIFLSAERGWFADGDPSAVGLVIPSAHIDSKKLPNNEASVWRLSGRTYNDLDFLTLRLGANINQQKSRTYTHQYAKNASEHNPRIENNNYSYTARLSRPLWKNSFINVNLGYKLLTRTTGDGVWFDNIQAYGDKSLNPLISANGTRVTLDPTGVFFAPGRVYGGFTKEHLDTYSGDFDMSSQVESHLIEVGGGYSANVLRYYSVSPVTIALGKDSLSFEQRARNAQPLNIGYDITGQTNTASGAVDPVTGFNVGPKKPVIAYAYLQDRYELKDLVLNFGFRVDYFDTKADQLKSESLPFVAGNGTASPADWEIAKAQYIFSPRIGLGFPVTDKTVFHSQFGKFVQQPRLIDMYGAFYTLQSLLTDDNFGVNTGHLQPEQTTQYELGFRQILGDNAAAVNVTLFYKNTKDLTNTTTRFFQRQPGGQLLRYYGPSNADFGTIKGATFTIDVARLRRVSLSINYTYSEAEGTGSSTSSSYTATFRNTNGEVPIVIAPLDFDQRHTGTVNLSFNTGKDELGILENLSANVLATFASGRPYTPLQSYNILAGATNYGDTKGYINSATMPGTFSVNVKVEKSFYFDKISITPYVWIDNLLNATNVTFVYPSTGDPYTTGYLLSPEGQANSKSRPDYVSDYQALERDPGNFGIPRQIRLGLKVNLGGVNL